MAGTPGHMHMNAHTHKYTHIHTEQRNLTVYMQKKKKAEYLITGDERILGVMQEISRKMRTDPII